MTYTYNYPTPEAWARIREALDAIVQREREKDEKEKAANATR